ncbi:hypothetical protein CA85_38710 [Allorhodopirellula solitaria]|uniref:Uncharacterized protein n=1 Tax=Allorhodopirellula solitaria TaxID=2527987 RepID=A0A5C5XAG9_9BACT|nr:hypothetical protein CA85_38710 [Allorhodopirellula solitaria]
MWNRKTGARAIAGDSADRRGGVDSLAKWIGGRQTECVKVRFDASKVFEDFFSFVVMRYRVGGGVPPIACVCIDLRQVLPKLVAGASPALPASA